MCFPSFFLPAFFAFSQLESYYTPSCTYSSTELSYSDWDRKNREGKWEIKDKTVLVLSKSHCGPGNSFITPLPAKPSLFYHLHAGQISPISEHVWHRINAVLSVFVGYSSHLLQITKKAEWGKLVKNVSHVNVLCRSCSSQTANSCTQPEDDVLKSRRGKIECCVLALKLIWQAHVGFNY